MFKDLQFVKNRANFVRFSFIEEMEKHLLAFETTAVSNGFKIQWINDEDTFAEALRGFFTNKQYNRVCFDLKNIPEVFENEKQLIKNVKVEDFESGAEIAETLVVDADFGIVENGSVVLANKRGKNFFNNVNNLIIVLDLNKLLVKQSDLDLMLFLKYFKDDAPFFPTNVEVITHPYKKVYVDSIAFENEDPFKKEEVNTTIFLYDNGISSILEDNFLRESLYCIDCGRCKKVCPVFAQVGKFSPIELIKHNSFEENLRDQNIFQNTTLCGNCNFICPVNIPLTDILISEMEIVNNRYSREKNIDNMKIFAKRGRLNKINNKIRRYFYIRKYYGKNKKLISYYSSLKGPFFNLTQTEK